MNIYHLPSGVFWGSKRNHVSVFFVLQVSIASRPVNKQTLNNVIHQL